MSYETLQAAALFSLGLFAASLIYEICIFRARLKIAKEKAIQSKLNSAALNAQLDKLTQVISVWGNAILNLKIKVVSKEEVNHGTQEQSTSDKEERRIETAKAVGTNVKERPLSTRDY